MALTDKQGEARLDTRREYGFGLMVLRRHRDNFMAKEDPEDHKKLIDKTIKALEELSDPDAVIVSTKHYQTLGRQQAELVEGMKTLKKTIKLLLTLDM